MTICTLLPLWVRVPLLPLLPLRLYTLKKTSLLPSPLPTDTDMPVTFWVLLMVASITARRGSIAMASASRPAVSVAYCTSAVRVVTSGGAWADELKIRNVQLRIRRRMCFMGGGLKF